MLLDLVGRDRSEVVGGRVDVLLTAGSRLFYHTHFFPLLKMEGEAREVYLSLRSGREGDVPCLVNARRITSEDAPPRSEAVLLPFEQRTEYEDELLRAKRAAEKASEAKDRFLSTVSHELRTPLTTIVALSELLRTGQRGPVSDQQKSDLDDIHEASDYLNTLITDVLDFARMEAGEIAVSPEPTSAREIVDRAVSLFRPRLERSDLELEVDAGPEGLLARADPDRTQQILLNLLTNAARYTGAGGTVGIRVEAGPPPEPSSQEGNEDPSRSRASPAPMALFHVWDTGVGIEKEDLSRIFDPFVQGSRTAAAGPGEGSDDGGVGLGLSISHDLARKMDGRLTAESEVGEGTTVTLALPIAASD